jgi:hypothetical protein
VILGYSLDDFTDDDLSPNDHAWLDSLTPERALDFAARHGYAKIIKLGGVRAVPSVRPFWRCCGRAQAPDFPAKPGR